MIPHQNSTNSYSTPSSLNYSSTPYTTTTTIPGLVTNTNNNGVRSDCASTSYDVNNSMDLEWDSEFPPGYRFCPKDEELICYYLQRRILNLNLPHDKIKDVNLYSTTPVKLCAEYESVGENDWYFFTPRDRKYKNGVRPNRAAGDGYWKATGADRDIVHPSKPKEVIGKKKALVFYKGKSPKGDKTNWIMHEYRVSNPQARKRLHDSDMRLDDCVLCRIYNKNDTKAKRKLEEINTEPNPSSDDQEEEEENEDEVEAEAEPEPEAKLVAKDEILPPEESQLLYNPGYIDEDAMRMGLYEENDPQFFYDNVIVKNELDCIVKKDNYPPQLPRDNYPPQLSHLHDNYPDISQHEMKDIYDDFYATDYQHGFEDVDEKSSFFSSINPLSFLHGEHNSTFFEDAEPDYKYIAPSNNLSSSTPSSRVDEGVVTD